MQENRVLKGLFIYTAVCSSWFTRDKSTRDHPWTMPFRTYHVRVAKANLNKSFLEVILESLTAPGFEVLLVWDDGEHDVGVPHAPVGGHEVGHLGQGRVVVHAQVVLLGLVGGGWTNTFIGGAHSFILSRLVLWKMVFRCEIVIGRAFKA